MEARTGAAILNCSQLKTKNKIMKKAMLTALCISCMLCLFNKLNAQIDAGKQKKPGASVVGWDGMVIAGYVDHGGFVNFGGPTLRMILKPLTIGFGILPTMRIKEDNVPKGSPKNSPVTPTAGFGFTLVYRKIALQVPFYYNSKTATTSGKWNPGIGIGYKL